MLKEDFIKVLENKGGNHILIHSDILFGFKFKIVNIRQCLDEHFYRLSEVCKSYKIIMPSFNYNFFKTKVYDVTDDKSNVGILSEYFRTEVALWRSSIPVFNFCGTGDNPIIFDKTQVIDPFGTNSVFDFLYKNKGVLLHYGSDFSSTTLLHYAERISGNLIYRYDKLFKGKVLLEEGSSDVELLYHVRPMGYNLDYDWDKIKINNLSGKKLALFSTSIYLIHPLVIFFVSSENITNGIL